MMEMLGWFVPVAIMTIIVSILVLMMLGVKPDKKLRRKTRYNKNDDHDRDPFQELFDDDYKD